MSFTFTKVVDITFIAKDVDQTASFYEKVGLKDLGVSEPRVFQIGDKELAIHSELSPDYPVPNPNTVYVSVVVNDLTELCRHLDEEGIYYFGPNSSHLGQESIHLTDPDGNHLEVHQQGS
jgi:catechol-2,3-dioxygenase